MIDFEKMQKINALSTELRKHHMAENSEDAYKQANQVYQEGPAQTTPAQENSIVVQPKEDYLGDKKMQLMLEMSQKKYEQEIQLLKSALKSVTEELDKLKTHVYTMERQQLQMPQKPKEKQAPLKTETKVENPRQGNYKSEDVDIQKMFYFGRK